MAASSKLITSFLNRDSKGDMEVEETVERTDVSLTDASARAVGAAFQEFLEEFQTPSDIEAGNGTRHYVSLLQNMVENEGRTMMVNYRHLSSYSLALAQSIESEFYRYELFLRRALDSFVRAHHPPYVVDLNHSNKTFFVGFYNVPTVLSIRQLRTEGVGRLVAVSGTVTRTSDVRPELHIGSFKCRKCQHDQHGVEQEFTYTTPTHCTNKKCNPTKDWSLNMDQCRFVDWQRARVQENADEIPAGSLPRSLDVIVRNELCERAKAGDKVIFTGAFVVMPDKGMYRKSGENVITSKPADRGDGVTGLRALGCRELAFRTAFWACAVQAQCMGAAGAIKTGEEDQEGEEFTEEQMQQFRDISRTRELYDRLAESIAPTIHGHMEIKRGLLLMLLGGVHKVTRDGCNKLRGDINVCLVGDPSTAKSQFLKYVHEFLPRGVYTSGKASSAAGLTAAVVKDSETGDFCVEAGALMLADNCICCIDEFDKMDLNDQVAIHEAMEQQTISIAKAGVHATLNARTSILAAANPLFGRYDKTKTLKANVVMSAPIMSRFDLFFVILDEYNPEADRRIAEHIVGVHQGRDAVVSAYFDLDTLRSYIRFAKTLMPQITTESAKVMVECYRSLRENDHIGRNQAAYRITVRQLESMVRLSEALARAELGSEIKPKHVREAYRLLKKSIIHVDAEEVSFEEEDDGHEEEAGNRPPDDDDDDSPDAEGFQPPVQHGGDAAGAEPVTQAMAEDGPAAEMPHEEDKAPKAAKKQTIPRDKYNAMVMQIVGHVQKRDDDPTAPITWGAVVDWLLQQETPPAENEREARKVINQVINRMLNVDRFLICIEDDATEEGREHKKLRVHPNFDVTSRQ